MTNDQAQIAFVICASFVIRISFFVILIAAYSFCAACSSAPVAIPALP
jgi:hypothetical protein